MKINNILTCVCVPVCVRTFFLFRFTFGICLLTSWKRRVCEECCYLYMFYRRLVWLNLSRCLPTYLRAMAKTNTAFKLWHKPAIPLLGSSRAHCSAIVKLVIIPSSSKRFKIKWTSMTFEFDPKKDEMSLSNLIVILKI